MVFDDGGMHCNRSHHHPDGKPYTVHSQNEDLEVNKELEFSDIQSLPSAALRDRGIAQDISAYYGVKVFYDQETGADKGYCYPLTENGKVVGYRVRTLPKKFSNVSEGSLKGRKLELFGQNNCANTKKLLIVGGQDDMLAAHQMLFRSYPNFRPSVVSVTNGENVKSVADNLDFVLSYSEVIICLDNDEIGKQASSDIAKLIGEKAKVMELPLKDANEMLLADRSKDFINCFFSAKAYRPTEIISIDDCFQEAIEIPKWGRKWPWPSLDKLTYGRRDGEGIYVGSAVKGGKTEWLSQMADYIINKENRKVFLCKFEQEPAQTIKALAGKIKHKQFHNPDHYEQGLFTQDELIDAVNQLRDHVLIFKAGFSDVGNGNMWDRLKPAIRHAVIAEGVKDIFIDPITQLTDGMTASETEQELRRFSNEIQGMAKDYGFFYYCFAHLKEPSTGLTHEEGGAIKVAQFRGSRAMAEKTKLMLGIIRNQFADDADERNTSTFHLLLNSTFGKPGKFEVFYNEFDVSYLEREQQY